jgi:hypothetical protein
MDSWNVTKMDVCMYYGATVQTLTPELMVLLYASVTHGQLDDV